MNRLANASSAYLKRSAHQPVAWYPWSEEAFERARAEDKPVFLSTGAVWCHWCHVMAKESFEDGETAGLLNELFINIKLDRDEHPDIDRRFQQAVAAMGGGSGWPLSVFLTADKKPFFGGTYFPLEDREGRPGFKNVLKAVSTFYRMKRDDATGYADKVLEALIEERRAEGELSETMLAEAEAGLLAAVDNENGGFGQEPKFPLSGALEFLIRRPQISQSTAAGQAARSMLLAMAAGGFHDHVGGGFHRYAVDKEWIMPHFEKMADDNAGLLRNYVDGYAVFGEERFREIAQGIIAFTRDVLSDYEGGFYASQDADVTPEDEGGYFTWTVDDLRKALDPDEFTVLSNFYLHEQGSMHHDPGKKVLYVESSPDELSERLGRPLAEVLRLIRQGREKLLAARARRETPFIDRSLYTSLNGMLISAWFHAYNIIGGEEIKRFAVRSLERILVIRRERGRLLHADHVPALLDDYVHLVDALVTGYEATGEYRYLEQADGLMAECLNKFFDTKEGGFFDTEGEVVGARLKHIEDVPHPSANGRAIIQLLRLSFLTGNRRYRSHAEQTLRLFAQTAQEIGIHAGSYWCALEAWYRMLSLKVEARPESELGRAARAIAGHAYAAIAYGEDLGRVIPCKAQVCLSPVSDAADLSSVCLPELR